MTMEEISWLSLTGTVVPVGVDILVFNGWSLNVMIVLGSICKYQPDYGGTAVRSIKYMIH